MTAADTPLREVLRGLPVFEHVSDVLLDDASLPNQPLLSLQAELRAAVLLGEPEPHAMTLSTVGPDGAPSSRVLLCKDVDDEALYFATSTSSRKGRELAGQPRAAASFYWRGNGRQFRVVGTCIPQGRDVSAADFAARGRSSRLAARVHKDVPPAAFSDIVELAAELDAELADTDLTADDWTVFALVPEEAELWQGRRDRLHQRVHWTRNGSAWRRGLLWP